DPCRVEVPAHMKEPDCPGTGFHPSALTHRSELCVGRLELVAIRVPLVERLKRRHAARGVDGMPQPYDGPPLEIIVDGRDPTRGERDPGAGVSRHGEGMRPRGMHRSSAGGSESVGWHT